MALIDTLRAQFHDDMLSTLTVVKPNKFLGSVNPRDSCAAAVDCYSMADTDNPESIRIAADMVAALAPPGGATYSVIGDKTGLKFQQLIAAFLETCFGAINPARAGSLRVLVPVQRGRKSTRPATDPPTRSSTIANLLPYAHLLTVDALQRANADIRAAFGGDYLVRPDIVVWKAPFSSSEIDGAAPFVDPLGTIGKRSLAWDESGKGYLLHASVSCKWTMRSDRAQNSRTEALNLIRSRKGRLPHVVAITAEPLPSRVASIAQGTGDIDCSYHVALPELIAAVAGVAGISPTFQEEHDILAALVDGDRLRDICDLPLDLLL